MLLQSLSSSAWTIIAILVATVLMWLMLYVATGWIVSKSFASSKKMSLLLAALLIVIIVPLAAAGAGMILGAIGGVISGLRDLIDGGGANYVAGLVSVIAFLVFILILHFVVAVDWKDTTWISLIGLFLLYCLFSFFPELNLMGGI